ncbi:delta 1-pyrroline-5-carboxylate synthetase [Rhodopirellula islandica]|uniref:Delta 1-pyrroline-5-carboxylate synthetase n=1 Tax=Rhodopirellula islandica TaxID=595434 RepID=A0A0J1BIB9_RHOIS|nr:aspartate kinase [Rhodopirellula islandica]KLU06287.1 delta 1-pyrroline-5-carboxylate synthetase [Rhodopirellula islandica]
MSRRVIKLGGSLLTRPSLLDDFHQWYRNQAPADDCLIIGGGQLIDAVREWDRLRPGDPQTVHWQCVAMLEHSMRHLAEALESDGRFPPIEKLETEDDWLRYSTSSSDSMKPASSTIQFLRPEVVYHSASKAPLPETWSTTTDSIAMWVALQCDASEVVLLKSCAVDSEDRLQDWITQGIVDPACAVLASLEEKLRVEQLPIQPTC